MARPAIPIIQGETEDLVCDLHARGLGPTQIVRELKKKEVTISQHSIWKYLNSSKNTPKLQKAIDKYRSDPLAVEVAHKRIRLDGMNRERLRILRELAKMCGDKASDIGRIPRKGWSRYTTLLKRLLEIYEKARDEIEKKPELVALFQSWSRTEITDEDLRKQIAEIDAKLLELRREKVGKLTGGENQGPKTEDKRQPA